MVKPNTIRLALSFILFILLIGTIRSQEYDVTIWGVPVGIAKLRGIADNDISLIIKSNEYINYIYPIELEYFSKFDTNYSVIENKKKTEQGKEKQQFNAVHKNTNIIIYNEKDSIPLNPNTHSLLSLLAKITNSSINSIDTKWFNVENEGILYEARLLWNDSTTVSINNENILCDHYRIDLRIIDENNKIFDKTDYFNELFFDINSVRQIWIERWQKQQRIIKITIKKNPINLSLTIKN